VPRRAGRLALIEMISLNLEIVFNHVQSGKSDDNHVVQTNEKDISASDFADATMPLLRGGYYSDHVVCSIVVSLAAGLSKL
jgi:hypothetical protein